MRTDGRFNGDEAAIVAHSSGWGEGPRWLSTTVCHMPSVSHREVRNISVEVLRRVEAGEELVVTNHGRPVARLLPLASSGLDDLERRGELRRARSAWSTLPLPAAAPDEITSAEALADLWRDW